MPVPARPDDAVTLDLVEDMAGFLALRRDWEVLFDCAAAPSQLFQSHVFLRHWATHYLTPDARLSIVTARRAGELAMVWPLIRQRRYGLDTLRFMGVPVAQFGDVLVGDGEPALLRAGWAFVQHLRADLFEARKLRADSRLALSGLLDSAVHGDRQEAPFSDLTRRVGESGPSLAYPPRERSNHRRRLRRLEERGPLAYVMPPPGPEAARLAAAAIAMKRATLARRGIVAPVVNDPRFGAFFADLAGDASGEATLRIASILSRGTPIGIDLSFDCKGHSFAHVLATDPEHEHDGIGKILIHHSFAGARARGSTVFDLLAPAEPYKRDHADGCVAVSDRLRPLSLKGRLACSLGIQHWRPLLKTVVKRLPAGLSRYVVPPPRQGA
jgi:CelD/BcsL family acetyltransferase involved in cellulose biosynthesis